MSEELNKYVHAMVMDEETGKPMPVVLVRNAESGGSVDIRFPSDYPDSESINMLGSLGVNSRTIINLLQELLTEVKKLTDDNKKFKVILEETENGGVEE